MQVNKIKAWDQIPAAVQSQLGPINSKIQWEYLAYTHEDNFGINTITKERPIGGGNARMVMIPKLSS